MSIVSIDKDVEGLRFVLVAEFDAPIVEVWELWADPRKLERWWGHRATPRRSTSTISVPGAR